jgi:calmodulin
MAVIFQKHGVILEATIFCLQHPRAAHTVRSDEDDEHERW